MTHGDDYLTPHFRLDEITHSDWAIRHGVENTPGDDQISFIREMLENCIEPIREHFGLPVNVESCFRSREVNTGVGGSRSSSHMAKVHKRAPFGEAAIDFKIRDRGGPSNLEVARWASTHLPVYDQIILENYDASRSRIFGWVHLGYRLGYRVGDNGYNRRDVKTKLFGEATYQNGLPPDPP